MGGGGGGDTFQTNACRLDVDERSKELSLAHREDTEANARTRAHDAHAPSKTKGWHRGPSYTCVEKEKDGGREHEALRSAPLL